MLAFLSWSSASSCPLNLLKLLLMSSSPCPDILPSIHPLLWSVLSVIKLPDCVRVFVTLKKAKLGVVVKEVLPVGWYWSLCLGSSFFCPQLDFHSPGGPRREWGVREGRSECGSARGCLGTFEPSFPSCPGASFLFTNQQWAQAWMHTFLWAPPWLWVIPEAALIWGWSLWRQKASSQSLTRGRGNLRNTPYGQGPCDACTVTLPCTWPCGDRQEERVHRPPLLLQWGLVASDKERLLSPPSDQPFPVLTRVLTFPLVPLVACALLPLPGPQGCVGGSH